MKSWARKNWAFLLSLPFCMALGVTVGSIDGVSITEVVIIIGSAAAWSLLMRIDVRNER